MNKEKEEGGKKSNRTVKSPEKSKSFFTDERIRFITGILITGFALYLLLACIAYLFWWKTDQSLPDSDIISGADVEVKNWSGKSGHFLAKMIIGYGFGYGAFFYPTHLCNNWIIPVEFSKDQTIQTLRKVCSCSNNSFTHSWFCFWKIRWIPDQWSGRCTGISCD